MAVANAVYNYETCSFDPSGAGTTVTWDAASGGLLGASIDEIAGEEVSHATATQTRPTINQVITVNDECRVTIDDLEKRPVINEIGTLTVKVIVTGGAARTYTMTGMVFMGISGRGNRGGVMSVELVFKHQSADGTTRPFSGASA